VTSCSIPTHEKSVLLLSLRQRTPTFYMSMHPDGGRMDIEAFVSYTITLHGVTTRKISVCIQEYICEITDKAVVKYSSDLWKRLNKE
jgi:hypothetical protein